MPQYRRGRRLLRPQIDHLDDRCLLSGLTPDQVTSAYGLSGITFTNSRGATIKGDGSGETIALVEAYHDPNLTSDLQTFDQQYKLSDPPLNVINQAGSQTNTGWSEEESLDVEWAHALAPGANILVVEANSSSLQDLLLAVDTARNTPGVVAVSMSWGFNEMSNEASFDSHFTTPSGHPGVTFVAASGDSGSMAGPSYPAASPNVLSVGGTTLTLLNASGGYGSETAWSGSGGGYSMFEAEPSYQAGIQTTGRRVTPDVAFDADPQTGVSVYVTMSNGRGNSQGAWLTVGGTSLGAPAWAAIIAIADQGRTLAGLGSLDGPNQTLPTLYQLKTADYHAVSSVPSIGYGVGFGSYGFGAEGLSSWFSGSVGTSQQSTSTNDANTATGLGSPNGTFLINDLVQSTLTVPVTTVPGSGSGGGSGGTTNPTTTPTPTPNPGGSRHHHPHWQSGTTTKGQTHKSGSTTVRKPAAQSSGHKTAVRHNGVV